MTHLFLRVNKDLFNLGLNPTEILVLAQVMEYDTNTGDCFISDKALAKMLSVSEKTISRTMKALEDKGFITRSTKNIKGGKERHIKSNAGKIDAALTTDKMTIDVITTDKMTVVQQTKCPLYNGQNDLIKDNTIKDKEKDNNSVMFQPAVENITLQSVQKAELEEISPEALLAMGARFEVTEDNLIRILDTGKVFKIKE